MIVKERNPHNLFEAFKVTSRENLPDWVLGDIDFRDDGDYLVYINNGTNGADGKYGDYVLRHTETGAVYFATAADFERKYVPA